MVSESVPVLLQLFCSLHREISVQISPYLLKSCSEVQVIHYMFAQWPEQLSFTMIGAWDSSWAIATLESHCPSRLRWQLQATRCLMSFTDPRVDIRSDVVREDFVSLEVIGLEKFLSSLLFEGRGIKYGRKREERYVSSCFLLRHLHRLQYN